MLRLRDDSKTRSLLTLWILNVLLQTNNLDYYRLLIQLLYLFVGGLDCEQVIFHFVENVLPRSSRIVREKEIV